jgi:hypothetical protein
MFIPFEKLPPQAKVWIYPLSRALAPTEELGIGEKLKAFVQQWKAHGHDLKASFKILHSRFIVLAVDEEYHAPSGCSIDSSVHAVADILQSAGLQLADRGQVFFLINNTIQNISVTRLRQSLNEGIWNADTLVFDTSVTTYGELNQNPVSAGKTWLVRYLKQVSV